MSTVTIFDFDIPVFDYLTAWEWERIELLTAKVRGSESAASETRLDMETLAVFIESRLGKRPNLDKLMREPIKGDELGQALEALLAPFYEGQRERLVRKYARAARTLTPEALEETIAALQNELESMRSASATPN